MCKIILALDVEKKADVERWVRETEDLVDFYKIGLALYMRMGPKSVEILKRHKKKVFLDLKFFDIPNTVLSALSAAYKLQVDLVNLHLLNSQEALIQIQEGVKKIRSSGTHSMDVIGVTLLTSTAGGNRIHQRVCALAWLARKTGFQGVVCSGQEAEAVRKQCGKNFLIVCPGIRVISGSDDQRRVVTPKQVAPFADYIVVGRPVLNADDPRRVLKSMRKELSE